MSQVNEFSREELIRYSRQLSLSSVGLPGQTKLKQAHAVVIGMGGLGCPASSYLAASGVGTISVIDHDTIETSNLQRQLLYRDADVGAYKADVAARELRKINPHINVNAHTVKQQQATDIIRSADVVLDCCDNFDSRYQTNKLCHDEGVDLVSAAAIRTEGQLLTLRFSTDKAPCYNCLFPQQETPPADNCNSAGILPPVVGQIGTAQALEAIKILINPSDSQPTTLQVFDALTFTWRSLRLTADPNCSVCSQQ